MILRLCYSPCYRDIASLRSIDDKTKDLSNFDYRPIALDIRGKEDETCWLRKLSVYDVRS